MDKIFYRPDNAWAADFIPFYANGQYRLFYLHDWRDHKNYGEGTPWYQISTDDFVHFTEHGEMLARGGRDEQDLYVFTGSVIQANGLYHIFYTGHNWDFPKQGKPMQAVMHATSNDLLHWKKIPEDTFYAPTDLYEPNDWRDPFVFWNEDAKEYWMLLAARFKTGPSRNRGCTALCSSKDLKTWKVLEPFWAPGLYYTHECPDLFKIGEWWYLVYSTFSERSVTHYRMSRSLQGPWLCPPNDTFDSRAYYAAKTASEGNHRFIFGWLPTRQDEKDDSCWHWGGNLVVHEVIQQPDGTLGVRVPETVPKQFQKNVNLNPHIIMGNWNIQNNEIVSQKEPGHLSALLMGEMPEDCMIETTISFDNNTANCGLLLRCDSEMEKYYQVRLDVHNQRMVMDRWPRGGDVPFILERPLKMVAGKEVHLRLIIAGTCLVIYANDQIALSCRMYEHRQGSLGLFSSEGCSKFKNITIMY
jgi:beta-fructofuranosidase